MCDTDGLSLERMAGTRYIQRPPGTGGSRVVFVLAVLCATRVSANPDAHVVDYSAVGSAEHVDGVETGLV